MPLFLKQMSIRFFFEVQSNACDVLVFVSLVFFSFFFFLVDSHFSAAFHNFSLLWSIFCDGFFSQHQGDFSHTFNATNTRCYFNVVYSFLALYSLFDFGMTWLTVWIVYIRVSCVNVLVLNVFVKVNEFIRVA